MKKIIPIVLCTVSFFYHTADAKKSKKTRTEHKVDTEDFDLSEEMLNSSLKEKKRLQKKLTPEQFLKILEEVATLRLVATQLSDRIKAYEDMETKFNEERQSLNAEIEKLKNATGAGEIAKAEFVEKIKLQGIDASKLRFRVQVGEFSSYANATRLKEKLRLDGEQTWILPIYMGYVIPLDLVKDKLK